MALVLQKAAGFRKGREACCRGTWREAYCKGTVGPCTRTLLQTALVRVDIAGATRPEITHRIAEDSAAWCGVDLREFPASKLRNTGVCRLFSRPSEKRPLLLGRCAMLPNQCFGANVKVTLEGKVIM